MSREKQIEEMAKVMCGYYGTEKCYDCRYCCDCHIKHEADRLYKAGYRKQSEGEWISAENPPEEYRESSGELIPFLVCCQGTVYPFRAMYDGANWGDGIGVLKVTHWMPLPEPPKGGHHE